MYIIEVYTGKKNRVMLEVSGSEAAYIAYKSACQLAAMTGASVEMWDDETCKTIATFNKED